MILRRERVEAVGSKRIPAFNYEFDHFKFNSCTHLWGSRWLIIG